MASHHVDAIAAAFRDATQCSTRKSSDSFYGLRQDSEDATKSLKALMSGSARAGFTKQVSLDSVASSKILASSSSQPSFTKQDFLGGAKPLTLCFELEPKHFNTSEANEKSYGFQKSLGRYSVTLGEANGIALPSCIAHFCRQPPSVTTFTKATSFLVSVRAMPCEFKTGSFGWHCHQKHTVTINGQKFEMNLNTNVPLIGSKGAHGSTLDEPIVDHASPCGRSKGLLKIPGIGPCVQERLRKVNITTPQQLQSMTPLMLEDVARATGISADGVMSTIGDYFGIDSKAATDDRAKIDKNGGELFLPKPRDRAKHVMLSGLEPKEDRRQNWISAILCVPTGVKRMWQSLTRQTSARDFQLPAIEGPPTKRTRTQRAHADYMRSAAATQGSPEAAPARSASFDIEQNLHPDLQKLLARARGESDVGHVGPMLPLELPGFQPKPDNRDLIAKRAEAESEAKRILAARTTHILGNGSVDQQKQEYRRLLLLLHPDHGLVDKDDKSAALALQLCLAAKKLLR